MIPALFRGLGQFQDSRLGWPARMLTILVLVLVTAQFLPVYRATALPLATGGAGGFGLFSPMPQQSLEAGLFIVALLGFFLFLSRFSDADLERLLRFVILGFLVNIVAGIVQLSYDQRKAVSDMLPFDIHAGFFANENHFSSLIYAMIPLVAYRYLVYSRRLLLYLLFVGLIVFFLFAVGSRAGMAISAMLGVFCLPWFSWPQLSLSTKVALVGAGVVGLAAIAYFIGVGSTIESDSRWTFYKTTWRAIGDYWLTGSGLGTFTMIYPAYEAREDTTFAYANHAHNDYLEILLEAGLAGLVLVGFFVVLLARHFGRSPLAQAAFLSMLAVLVHSLVDYPLRTMALATVFSYLAAVVLSTRNHVSDRAQSDDAKPADFSGEFVSLNHPERY
jgi:O-antigen ligase